MVRGAVDLAVPAPAPPEPFRPFGPPPRETRLELHQPQPPTASTGTTYSIEMYQCIRQARAFILHLLSYHSGARDETCRGPGAS